MYAKKGNSFWISVSQSAGGNHQWKNPLRLHTALYYETEWAVSCGSPYRAGCNGTAEAGGLHKNGRTKTDDRHISAGSKKAEICGHQVYCRKSALFTGCICYYDADHAAYSFLLCPGVQRLCIAPAGGKGKGSFSEKCSVSMEDKSEIFLCPAGSDPQYVFSGFVLQPWAVCTANLLLSGKAVFKPTKQLPVSEYSMGTGSHVQPAADRKHEQTHSDVCCCTENSWAADTRTVQAEPAH